MRSEWIALAVVGLVSAVAGVAIAGWPGDEPVAETIAVPETSAGDENGETGETGEVAGPTSADESTTPPPTTATTTTTTSTTTTSTPPTTATTSTSTTTSTSASTTTSTTTTSTTTRPSTTVARSTTVPTSPPPSSPPPSRPLADRSEVLVLAVNGAGTPGLGRRTAWKLREMGYERAFYDDGTGFADVTRVYVRRGLRAEGRRLADDLGLAVRRPRPLDEAPPAETGSPNVDLFVYLGRDFELR